METHLMAALSALFLRRHRSLGNARSEDQGCGATRASAGVRERRVGAILAIAARRVDPGGHRESLFYLFHVDSNQMRIDGSYTSLFEETMLVIDHGSLGEGKRLAQRTGTTY